MSDSGFSSISAEITGGLGIGDITYGDSESEESQQEDEEDEEGGTARVYRGDGDKLEFIYNSNSSVTVTVSEKNRESIITKLR